MGQTNLLSSLKTKYASLSGEAESLHAQIARTKADYDGVGALETRLTILREGVTHGSRTSPEPTRRRTCSHQRLAMDQCGQTTPFR